MSQDFQQIGQASTELDAVANERQGWDDQTDVKPQVEEMSGDFDFSFRDRRANLQALGLRTPNMAGYTETPTAATEQPAGWDRPWVTESGPTASRP